MGVYKALAGQHNGSTSGACVCGLGLAWLGMDRPTVLCCWLIDTCTHAPPNPLPTLPPLNETSAGVFQTVVLANNVRLIGKDSGAQLKVSAEDIGHIRQRAYVHKYNIYMCVHTVVLT